MDARPIGLFDSGVGGLSVLRHLQLLAPGERYIYFADTQYFPYGPRTAAEVRKRAFAIVHRLRQSDVKMVVIACNTASTAAVKDLREAFEDLPFVAMVPGLKPAAALSKNGVVAVLATNGTIDGDMYARVLADFGRGARVLAVACHGLAERVETGDTDSAALRRELRDAVEPAVREGADTVVLGCTHFHFLEHVVAEEFPGLAVVGTAEPVARRAVQVLAEKDLQAPPGAKGGLSIIVSGDRAAFWATMGRLGFVPAGANV